MIHVVLVEPEIPPNTGNIARTCAATGIPLHLVEPLGFSISDRYVKRAGLDYWKDVDLHLHRDLPAFFTYAKERCGAPWEPALLTTKGSQPYTRISLPPEGKDLFLLFGPETRGLPADLLARFPDRRYRIPMVPERRSLNLSNSVAVVVYDLLRRAGFERLE